MQLVFLGSRIYNDYNKSGVICMKKLCLFILILSVFTFVSSGCVNGKDNTDTTADGMEETTVLSEEEKEEITNKENKAKATLEKLIAAKTEEEVAKYTTEMPEGYAENVFKTFSKDNYVVSVKSKGKAEGCDAFLVEITCKDDPEFYMKGIELFKETDKGYLVENSVNIYESVKIKYNCKTCEGYGYDIVMEGDCPICEGLGMVYEEKAEYDKKAKKWESGYVDCYACGGTGEANNTSVDCEDCDGLGVNLNNK